MAAWRRLGSGSPGARASGDSHAEGWARGVARGGDDVAVGANAKLPAEGGGRFLSFAILGLPAQFGGQESGRVGGYWKASELFHWYVGP